MRSPIATRAGEAGAARATALALAVVVCAILPLMLTGGLALQLRRDLGVSSVQIGLASTIVFGTGAVGSGAFGRFIQQVGPSIALRLAALLSVVSLAGTALFARSSVTYLSFLVVAGLANAMSHPAANLALVSTVPLYRQGLSFGVKQSALPAAGLLAGIAVPTVALTVGWRYIFAIGAVIACVVMLLTPVVIPHQDRVGFQTPVGRLSVGWLPMMVLTIAAGLGSMATNSFGAFLVLSATESGLSEASAGLLLSVSSAAGILARIAAGWLVDRLQSTGFAETALLLTAGALGFAVLAIQAPAASVVGSLVGFGLGWTWPGLFNYAVARVNPEAPATATGVVQTGIHVGAATGPLLFGILATRASFPTAWLVMAGLALVAGALMAVDHRWLRDARVVRP